MPIFLIFHHPLSNLEKTFQKANTNNIQHNNITALLQQADTGQLHEIDEAIVGWISKPSPKRNPP